jgi:hypothetical protein
MKQSFLEFYDHLDKARDRALWLEFEHRNIPKHFMVFDGRKTIMRWRIYRRQKKWISHHYSLPETYEHLSYGELKEISRDTNMLEHWEDLLGKFSVMEGEILRFVLM